MASQEWGYGEREENAVDPYLSASPWAKALRLVPPLIRACRPRQWLKNVLVAAAPFAAGEILRSNVPQLFTVFALFVVASSSIYLINDCVDVEVDRRHPEKRHRPVAAGSVPIALAYSCGGVLAAGSPIAAWFLCDTRICVLLATYVALQVCYCFWLKHVALIELVIVVSGFLIRAMSGGLALGIPLSRWFLITTGFGSLFAVSAKRYSEVVVSDRNGYERHVIQEYTDGYLRFVWQLAAGTSIIAYCLWALAGGPGLGGGALLWRQFSTVPFILGVLRYAMFAERGSAEAPEEVLRRDRPFGVLALTWIGCYGMSLVR